MTTTSTFNTENYVHILSQEAERPFSFCGTTREDFEEWRSRFKAHLLALIGIDLIRRRGLCPLEPVCLQKETLDCCVREEWTIQTEPGFHLPFYLLKPLDAASPRPLVITCHGHNPGGHQLYVGICASEKDRLYMQEGNRDVAVQAVKQGYITIAPAARAMGVLMRPRDIQAGLRNSCLQMQRRAILFGRTLIGERVWDVSRLLDFALSRDDINPKQVGITGNSGGGKVAIYAAACDERITISATSSHFGVYQYSIGSVEHCICNFEPGLLESAELYDVAGLIAPRPFLAVVGDSDPNHPADGARLASERVKKIYAAAGVPDRHELHVIPGGHRFYKETVWPFFRSHWN